MRRTAGWKSLRRWCQAAAERANAVSRGAAQREESDLRDRLAFTGQPD
jgi:hypothetical protein